MLWKLLKITVGLIMPDWRIFCRWFIFFSILFLRIKEKAFNEPMDAIVYGVVVSLGFATLENYDYVFRLAEEYKSHR